MGYTYDAAGNMTKLTYPDRKTVSYIYDVLNRLVSVSIDWRSKTMTYEYDNANRLTDINHFNGMHTGKTLDRANRRTGLVHDGNGTLASYSYLLDENGNREKETANAPILPAGLINKTTNFIYNDEKNRLQSASGTSLAYDFEGQQSQKGGTAYQFDHAHRLTKIGTNRTFVYDGVGNRIRATRNSVQKHYIHDAGGNLIAEADHNGNVTRYYIYAKGLTAMVTPGGAVYVYHFDGTGHTVAIANSTSVPVNKYAYSAYGEILGQQEEIPQPFKYAGQVGIFAEAGNIYYMRARYYDAGTGRFISEDPAGFVDGPNLYAYVGGNPIVAVDPSGLSSAELGFSQSSRMTQNPDGNWQYRDNAAFAAAGLGGSTITHSCGGGSVGLCVFTATVFGQGGTAITNGIEDAVTITNSGIESLEVKVPLQAKILQYLFTVKTRWSNNLDACKSTCGKESFQR